MKIGIIGAGQLARMLSIAGTPLGLEISAIGGSNDCANDVIKNICDIDLQDEDSVVQWAKNFDVITFENENIDCNLIKAIQTVSKVYPSVKSIQVAQDRLLEKNTLASLDIRTAPYYKINTISDLQDAVEKYGLPAIIKTRHFGYDGKGQYKLETSDDIDDCWNNLGSSNGGLIYEGFVNFEKELSLIATIDIEKNIVFYPLTHNEHDKGILIKSTAPYIDNVLQLKAQSIMGKLVKELDYVGTLSIEFFVCNDGLIVNEIAPRVHNSGHWTIEGATTSQFENHMRAIAGLSLGDSTSKNTIMFNCIGTMPNRKKITNIKNAHYHNYNKSNRFGRKVGHITLSNTNDKSDVTLIEKLVKDALEY